MKSLLDSYWNNFRTVQFREGLYGVDPAERIQIISQSGLEKMVFAHPNAHSENSFLNVGYNGLAPITDLGTIRMRQEVIRAFASSFEDSQSIQTIFNDLHLLTESVNKTSRENYSDVSLLFCRNSLDRYQAQIDLLVQELSKQDGVLGRLSEHYKQRFPKSVVENVVGACISGGFNYIVGEINPRDLKRWGGKRKTTNSGIRLHGVMALNPDNIKGQVILSENPNSSGRINHHAFVVHAFNQCIDWLNQTYSPLAALFYEGAYLHGADVCLPEINNEGIFEIIDGRPILPTPNPIGTSLQYDKTSAKLVLNGIHSGGKSHLLKTIASYHLVGLSGFPVPARSAKIPLIKRIFHSFDIEKMHGRGSLESEFFERAETLEQIKEGDLVLMDEFLQHASPDASTDLEPIILEEFYKTGAAVVVVTHRGDSLDDKNKWQFYSPGFVEKAGRIAPTYQFQKGKPSQEVLRKHAKQMLEDALTQKQKEESKK